MARMHSGKRGKSGSKNPIKKVVPTWSRYKPKEVELLVLKLAKEGKNSSQIGIILRDTYGVPDVKVLAKKSITEILGEKSLLPEIPEDLTAVLKKNVTLLKHMEKNKMDQTAKRGIILAESKIKRLVKYYKRTGRISHNMKYDSKKGTMFME